MTNDFKNRRTFSKLKLTKEEYAAKKKSEKDMLYKMSDEAANEVVATSGNYQTYLDTQARLDRYSAINTLLIYHQFPNAAKLKSFEDWRSDNVKINKGAKSISILEPIEYTRNDGTSGISYNVKKMFDISQTSAKPNESQALNVSTKEFIMTLLENVGIEVESKNDLPYEGLAAYFDEKDQRLYVRPAVGDDVLLANHGLLAGGTSLADAFNVIEEIEFCCEIYYRTKSIGDPVILPEDEMARMVERFKDYGKKPEEHEEI